MPSVLIVDDLTSIHEMLEAVIQPIGFTAAFATDGTKALERYKAEKFDLVLVDVKMAPMDGLALLRELKKLDPQAVVVVMTAYASTTYALDALKLGAFDFLQKPFNEQVLLDRVQEAVQFAAAQRAARGWLAEIQARIDSLTARESDVMAGMVAGRLNKQIAEGLGISIKTVEQHRARVMEKLQVDSLAELVRLVVGVGWSAESKNGQ